MQRSPFALFAERELSPDNDWYRLHSYDPPFLRVIPEEDHQTLIGWYTETKATYPNTGASGVEIMTLLTGLVMSTGINRVVQCGHYVGFSALLLAMVARQMGTGRFLYTVDIDPVPSAFTQRWIERAGLAEKVMVAVHDSSDPVCIDEAQTFLGGKPQLVYVDSSHQYDHTRSELMLWWEALPPGGLLAMHDVSGWAARFDRTGKGGSHRAAMEFRQHHAPNGVILNSNLYPGLGAKLVYTDICGFGLLQKPYPFAEERPV